jgi:hypothetical protein
MATVGEGLIIRRSRGKSHASEWTICAHLNYLAANLVSENNRRSRRVIIAGQERGARCRLMAPVLASRWSRLCRTERRLICAADVVSPAVLPPAL